MNEYALKVLFCAGLLIIAVSTALSAQDSAPEALQAESKTVDTATSPQVLTKKDIASEVEKAVAKKVRPLERELRAFKEEIRFHDIIGGIGYIVGVMGLAFYFLGIRRRDRDRKQEPRD